jgi:regulator of sirC expression with transglutaminase-like and TPR domain
MELETSEIRLDCAALHLARDAYPEIHLPRYLSILDEMAEEVAARRPGLAANLRYEAMRDVLVETYNFTGNAHHYYNPENLYLNRVLDARAGIPVSLSVVWIEVARRLKWPVSGVALPGNFVVRFDDPERFVIANPYQDGRSLSLEDCRLLVQEGFEGRLSFSSEQLRPVDTRAILMRLLRNLRNIYLANNDLPRLQDTLRRMLAVQPASGKTLQDLAAVCARQGDMRGAGAYLEAYLRRQPRGRDAGLVRRNLRQVRAALLALN